MWRQDRDGTCQNLVVKLIILTFQESTQGNFGILGIAPVGKQNGHVVVYGDSNCLDSSHMVAGCYEFLLKLLDRVVQVSTVGCTKVGDLDENQQLLR